ncbi:MAG: bifunctional precorrin-2 dehydrogenase/sirohydrochlorin ferrochelatase [Bacillota bacterium]
MAKIYPVCLRLEDRLCVVVGGGAVAERKVLGLLEASARVRVVSPVLTRRLAELAAKGVIEHVGRPYRPGDVAGAFVVISATDEPEVNALVAEECASRGIPVNVVDEPALSSFFVPAVVRRGDLVIAVSTGGRSPLAARRIKEELAAAFGPAWAEYLVLAGERREEILREVEDPAVRERLLDALAGPEVFAAVRDGDLNRVKELIGRAAGHGRA